MRSERRLEVAQQRMAGVLVRKDCLGRVCHPVYAEFGVCDGYSSLCLGAIQIIALVLEYGGIAEYGESVSETTGNEELPVIVFGQNHADMAPVSGRVRADIDCHVKHLAADAAHQLGLGVRRRLEVKSAHNAAYGTGFVVLDEVNRANQSVECLLVVRFEEITPRILKNAWLQNVNARYVCLDQFHVRQVVIRDMMLFERIVDVGFGLVYQTHQVPAILILHHGLGKLRHFLFGDPALVECDSFQASDLAALAFLKHLHID